MKPKFIGKPIASVDALARALSLSTHQLLTLAGAVSSHYRDFSIHKKDGSLRDVSGPTEELKIIQKRINRQIFERVEFPDYLFGSIRDRNYIQNAKMHSRAYVLISLDVKNYFPSVKFNAVFNVFKYFFKFPESVAKVLTDLCTKDGALPQGACTSSYLANLVLFDIEHRLVSNLKDKHIVYSRLIDDISISSSAPISKERISRLIEQVASMLKTAGFLLKRSKTKVSSKDNMDKLMEVTGLWLNLGEPRVKRDTRIKIRKEVRRCIQESKFDSTSPDYHKLHNRTSGRVAMLSQLKHPEAKRFRWVLNAVSPTYTHRDIKKTTRIVDALCKTPIGSRGAISYIKRFYQARYRINIVGRTENLLANRLHAKLSMCQPTMTIENAIHG